MELGLLQLLVFWQPKICCGLEHAQPNGNWAERVIEGQFFFWCSKVSLCPCLKWEKDLHCGTGRKPWIPVAGDYSTHLGTYTQTLAIDPLCLLLSHSAAFQNSVTGSLLALESGVGSGDNCSEIMRFICWLIVLGSQWLLQDFQWDLVNEP